MSGIPELSPEQAQARLRVLVAEAIAAYQMAERLTEAEIAQQLNVGVETVQALQTERDLHYSDSGVVTINK